MTTHSHGSRWLGPHMDDENVSNRHIYSEFKEKNSKPQLRTVSEIFGAQLKQLKGFSGSKAEALLDVHPCPSSLLEAFRLESEIKGHIVADEDLINERKTKFVNMVAKNSRQKFGPSIGNVLAEFFCN